ncbi:hypothetical protein A9Q83_03785 [Alphaproteobacteria bacterium 46_93_T64]|nr:hypothetical protein A9Q83_03785 [Alphaproteobacteria bacterium 46_93_T64]
MTNASGHDNRRKFQRNSVQRVVVVIDNLPYLAQDWSPDGFSILIENNGFKIGDLIEGDIDIFEVPDAGQFSGKVIRKKDRGFLAVQFDDVSSHIFLNLCMTVAITNEDAS